MDGGDPRPPAEASIGPIEILDSDSSTDAPESFEPESSGASVRDGPSKKKRKCNRKRDYSRQTVLHEEQPRPRKEQLMERRIREYDEPSYGQLKKKAQYVDTGGALSSSDETWWLQTTPPPPIAQSHTRHRRDRPACLSHFEVGDEVFVGELKGTVARPNTDSEDDSDEDWLTCNTVPVKFNGSGDTHVRIPRNKLRNASIDHCRDRPACLSHVKVGHKVSVKGLKGTVVRPNSDSEDGSDEHRLKCNKVVVKFKGLGDTYIRIRRSKLRNRTINLLNLPQEWTGKIRLRDSLSDTLQGTLHLFSPHHKLEIPDIAVSRKIRLDFLRDGDVRKADCDAVEASFKEAFLRARTVWPWLFNEEEDSEITSGDDYNGDFCKFCGEGGEDQRECDAKGCVVSKHIVCICRSVPGKSTLPKSEDWFCEQCKHEAFLLDRRVQARVEDCPALQYFHQVLGAPSSWSESNAVVSFEVPKMLPPPNEYSLGVIHGSCGSGKSLLLKKRFGHAREAAASLQLNSKWQSDTPIIGLVHPDAKEAFDRLLAVGLESEAGMPFPALSDGQQMQAIVAWQLAGGATLDAFASSLDDTTAHALCRGVSRFVRERGLSKVVVASSHPRAVEWLRPDWSYDTDSGHMKRYAADDKEWAPRLPHAVTGAADAVRSKLGLDALPRPLQAAADSTTDPDTETPEVIMMEISDSESVELDGGGDLTCPGRSGGSPTAGGAAAETEPSAHRTECSASGAAGADARANGEEAGAASEPEKTLGEEKEDGGGGEQRASMAELAARAEGLEAQGDWEGAWRAWDAFSKEAQELAATGERKRRRCEQMRRQLEQLERGGGGPVAVTLQELRDQSRPGPNVRFDASSQDIEIQVADPGVWAMFRKGHYLDKPGVDIKGAHVYVATLPKQNGMPVGMVAVRCQPGVGNNAKTRKHNGCYRESRLVVHKVWRGIGIASAISNAIAQAYTDAGCIYTACFRHPRMHKNRAASKLWMPLKGNKNGGHSCPVPHRPPVQRSPKYSYIYVGVPSTSESSSQREAQDEQDTNEMDDAYWVDSSGDEGWDWDDDPGLPIRIVGARNSTESDSDDVVAA